MTIFEHSFKLAGVHRHILRGSIAFFSLVHVFTAQAFDGRIAATRARGGETQTLLYTVGTSCLRIERGETNWPHAKNLVARDTGEITLLFPHNRSFVRLKPAAQNALIPSPMMPARLTPPPGTGPQNQTPPAMPPPPMGVGPSNLPGLPPPPVMPQMPVAGTMPAMPMMPMPGETLELKATGETTNLLGYVCARYEIKQRGEIMEIWATDKLLPFQAWQPNQPPRFGPRMIEEQWGDQLKARKLFPLLAVLKFENGPERLRFEVKTIAAGKIEDRDGTLFQPPPGYQEMQPLPL